MSAGVLVVTEMVVGVGALAPAAVGEIDNNLMLMPLIASAIELLLEIISAPPSMRYFASFGASITVDPVSRPELPDSVRSEPTPIVVEVKTRREPVESVRMFALNPDVPNCELIDSRTCCSVAPAGMLRS
ncbi:hypothetical protein D3C72_1981230 [compost metagenome]